MLRALTGTAETVDERPANKLFKYLSQGGFDNTDSNAMQPLTILRWRDIQSFTGRLIVDLSGHLSSISRRSSSSASSDRLAHGAVRNSQSRLSVIK